MVSAPTMRYVLRPMHTLLIDDHALFRCGMRLLLGDLAGGITCAEADSVDDALHHAGEPIELILLDLHLPGRSGIGALRAVRETFPETAVVVVSGDPDPDLIRESVRNGAAAFIPKALPPPAMVAALRRVLAGGCWLPPADLEPDGVGAPDGAPRGADCLSALALGARQHDALLLAARGKSTGAIARALALDPTEAVATVEAAFDALGVCDRTEAVYAAAELGLAMRATPAAE